MAKKSRGGYRRPPKDTQFKKGHSGNPRGRPKKSKNFKTVLEEELAEKIAIREQGKVKTVTKLVAGVKAIVAKTIQGDARHATILIKKTDEIETGNDAHQSISEARRSEILRRHEQRQRAWFFEEFQRLQKENPDED